MVRRRKLVRLGALARAAWPRGRVRVRSDRGRTADRWLQRGVGRAASATCGRGTPPTGSSTGSRPPTGGRPLGATSPVTDSSLPSRCRRWPTGSPRARRSTTACAPSDDDGSGICGADATFVTLSGLDTVTGSGTSVVIPQLGYAVGAYVDARSGPDGEGAVRHGLDVARPALPQGGRQRRRDLLARRGEPGDDRVRVTGLDGLGPAAAGPPDPGAHRGQRPRRRPLRDEHARRALRHLSGPGPARRRMPRSSPPAAGSSHEH